MLEGNKNFVSILSGVNLSIIRFSLISDSVNGNRTCYRTSLLLANDLTIVNISMKLLLMAAVTTTTTTITLIVVCDINIFLIKGSVHPTLNDSCS